MKTGPNYEYFAYALTASRTDHIPFTRHVKRTLAEKSAVKLGRKNSTPRSSAILFIVAGWENFQKATKDAGYTINWVKRELKS